MLLLLRIPHCLPSPPQHLSLSSLSPSRLSRSSACTRPRAPSNAGFSLQGGASAGSSVAKEKKKKKGSTKVGYKSEGGEELVRILMRNFDGEKPLVSTLNKYVKVVRTEHCFMLFEELGKKDKWLQCLEVVPLSPSLPPSFLFFYLFSILILKFLLNFALCLPWVKTRIWAYLEKKGLLLIYSINKRGTLNTCLFIKSRRFNESNYKKNKKSQIIIVYFSFK